jgi:hypothetical protein
MKNVNIKIKMTEIARGILRRVKKSSKGANTNERKTARKNGKSTGFANRRTTPPMKMTMINNDAVTTLFPCITRTFGHHYSPSVVETKAIFPLNTIPSSRMPPP